MRGFQERLKTKRLDEIYALAKAGAWDGDKRATVLVQALRDLWDFRATDLKDIERLRIDDLTPEALARLFHETYERFAPEYGYETRRETAVPWDDVPEPNRSLMIAVAAEILDELQGESKT